MPLKFLTCVIFKARIIINIVKYSSVNNPDNADVKRTTMRELRVLKMLKQENIVQLR